MKKILIIITAVIVLGAVFVIAILPPKDEPITLPTKEEITSIVIVHEDKEVVLEDADQVSSLIERLNEGRPTRLQSVNDSPPSDYDYYEIIMKNEEEHLDAVYVYSVDDEVHIEHPYRGIYIADPELISELDILSAS